MHLRSRLLILLALTFSAALLLGAAALAGRSLPTMLAAVQMVDAGYDWFSYGLVDIDRDALIRRTVSVPGYAGASFDTDPPRVLQVTVRGDNAAWTLSALEPATGTLTTEVKLNTPASVRLGIDMFRQLPNGGWSIHNFQSSDLYYAASGDSEASLLMSVPITSVVWSHDSSRLAVENLERTTIMSIESGEPLTIPHEGINTMNVRWSSDDRYVALTQSGNANNTLLVADSRTGEIVAQYDGHTPSWCGSRLAYAADTGGSVFEARLADPSAGTEEVLLTRDLSEVSLVRRTIVVSGLNRDTCDWLLVITGSVQYELLHPQTGALISLGDDMQFQGIDVADDGITYLVSTAGKTELRRIKFDPGVQSYEVLAALGRMSTSLTWIDDSRGGIYMLVDELVRIDAESGAQTALNGPRIWAFYVMH